VNISRRLVIFIFFLLLILLVGMLFGPFILNEIIKPISLVAWLLLRLFVLSIDQKYYWGAIVFVVVFFLFRFLPLDNPALPPDEDQNSNATMRNIRYWHSLFTLAENDSHDDKTLKRELARLLLALYATKQRTAADFRLYDALQQGEIPIPEYIHTFLFVEEPQETRSSLKKFAQSIWNAPRKWIHRWTGQEAADYYFKIDAVLSLMETTLEMKNDNGKFNPN
jgi:hypothetical protein